MLDKQCRISSFRCFLFQKNYKFILSVNLFHIDDLTQVHLYYIIELSDLNVIMSAGKWLFNFQ